MFIYGMNVLIEVVDIIGKDSTYQYSEKATSKMCWFSGIHISVVAHH
jgi:hypothetical protein